MLPFNIGPGELILILIIALVVLGPGKLPDVASSLGRSIKEFRKAASDVTEAGKLDAPAKPVGSSTSPAAMEPTGDAAGTSTATPVSVASPPPPPPPAEPVQAAADRGAPARDPNPS